MPLTRGNVTVASRVMLPVYPTFATIVGLSFLGTPKARLLATPGLRFVAELGLLEVWGVGFLLCATALIIALLANSREVYCAALAVLGVWLALWSGLLVASALYSESTWSAWAWPAFIAAACWATLLSLQSREAR